MTVPVFSGRHHVAVPCGATLGEAPIWDWRSDTLYWVDIDGCMLWRWRPGGGEEAVNWTFGQRVTFVKLTPDEDLLVLGMKAGVYRFRPSEGGEPHLLLDPEPGMPGNRLNDAGVAPDGSLLFGTMDDDEKAATGSFYRWSTRGLIRFGEHAIVTNGPTVDHANRWVYLADTTEGRVYRHPVAEDGTPGPREDFVAFKPGDGHPDGLTVDAEEHVWVCHFGGGRITRFSPEGEPVLVVPLPTGLITKVAFGGPELRTAYVTTASRGRDRTLDPMAGQLLSFESPAPGQRAHICRMAQ